MDCVTRRRFLQSLAAGGALYAFGRTPGTVVAEAAGLDGFPDYKALVCVFLAGGNDSWSMLVPRSNAEYDVYATSRQNLAIPRDQLLPIAPLSQDGAAYGFHPSMPGLQSLFESGRCAVVANVGPLVERVTKEQYLQRTARLPLQLFSHRSQLDQWHTLGGAQWLKTGWAGRVADVLVSLTTSQQLPLNVSLSGTTLFQAGEVATPYVMGLTGSTFAGLTDIDRRASFERVLDTAHPDVYERAFADVQKRALHYATLVSDALKTAPALATVFPRSALGSQLRTIAKMIASRHSLGMSRQIFFVSMGGFDTHNDQLALQPGLFSDLSASLYAFHQATVELRVASKVTTFTHSEFGRTLTSNGDGSDHAWGSVQLVIGNSVKGRTFYGRYPLLRIGSPEDVGGGRMIPALSSDQYAATLAKWFGVEPSLLPQIAPNVGNFTQQDLGFML